MLNYYEIKYVLDYNSIPFLEEGSCIGTRKYDVYIDILHPYTQPINMYNFIKVLLRLPGAKWINL